MKKKFIRINLVLTIIAILSVFYLLDTSYRVPVLMYHSVNVGSENSRLIVDPDTFKKQMNYLQNKNFNFMSLDEYVEILKTGEKPKRKSVVITFDDGFKDNYLKVFPLLKQLKIPAAFFIVTDWVGREDRMSWNQIKEMSENDLMEIGSHTVDHEMLTRMPKEEMISQIKSSKKIIASFLNKPIEFFCYPTGAHSEFIKEITRLAGYKAACATSVDKRTAFDDLFAIRRIRISQSADNMFIFSAQVSGYYTFFKDRRIKKGKWKKY